MTDISTPQKWDSIINEYGRDDFELEEYGGNTVDDMMVDYDYHVNTGDLPELFDESSVDDFIANLNDWD